MLMLAKEIEKNSYYLFDPKEGYIIQIMDNRTYDGDIYLVFKKFKNKAPIVIEENEELKVVTNDSEPLFFLINKLFSTSIPSKYSQYYDKKSKTLTHPCENGLTNNTFEIQKTKENISITYNKRNDTPFEDSIRVICLRPAKKNPNLAYALCNLIDDIKAFDDFSLVVSIEKMRNLMSGKEKQTQMIYEN